MHSESETIAAATPRHAKNGVDCRCAVLRRRSISLRLSPGGAGCRSNERFNSLQKHPSAQIPRMYSFKWFSALARNSFRPRCKLLFTVARGAASVAAILRRQLLLMAENQRPPVLLGQRGQQLLQPRTQRRGAFFRRNAVAFLNRHPQAHAPHLAPPQRIRRAAHRHAAQPEASVICGLDLAQALVEFQKNILRNLFGQAAVAGHAQRQRKDHRLVLVHELFKIRLPVVGHIFASTSLSAGNAARGCKEYALWGKKFATHRPPHIPLRKLKQRKQAAPELRQPARDERRMREAAAYLLDKNHVHAPWVRVSESGRLCAPILVVVGAAQQGSSRLSGHRGPYRK